MMGIPTFLAEAPGDQVLGFLLHLSIQLALNLRVTGSSVEHGIRRAGSNGGQHEGNCAHSSRYLREGLRRVAEIGYHEFFFTFVLIPPLSLFVPTISLTVYSFGLAAL
jgi:hypothetical protein